MNEFGLIDVFRRSAGADPRVPIGIGDDCALIRPSPGRDLLVTTDMLMEGRHFRLAEAGGRLVGYKAMAVNLSDIAAMAGVPLAAFVSVALPKTGAASLALDLLAGIRDAADRYGTALAGGDTNAWDGPLVINIALLGESPPQGAVLRSGAKAGEAICVTGPLGGSLLGRHLRPIPRLAAASALRGALRIGGMIDVSDGLLADLGHVLQESGGLGAILDEDAIPIHEDAIAMSRQDGRSPLNHACDDGEDFELCLTISEADVERARRLVPSLRRIGSTTADPGLRLRGRDGELRTAEAKGFDHLSS